MQPTPEFELRANAFGLLGRSAPSPILGLAPPLAGLIAAACLAWLTCPAPPSHSLTWRDLLVSSTIYMVTGVLASTAAALSAYAVLPGVSGNNLREITLRTAAGAVWFAPLGVFLSQMSVWVVAPAVMAATSITGLLQFAHAGFAPAAPAPIDGRPSGAIFRYQDPPLSVASLLFPLSAAVSFQAACAAALMDHIAALAALSGLGTSMVAFRWTSERSSGGSAFRAAMMIALATIVTAAGLARYLEVKHRLVWGGSGRSGNELAQTTNAFPLGKRPSQLLPKPTLTSNSGATTELVGSVYPGIVLMPEQQAHSLLIPPLPSMGHGLFSVNRATPLSIPFFGVYWFFKTPDTRPPGNSLRAYGSPVEHTFRSTDHNPLFMEARQNLGTSIYLSCCREIQIAIRNADTYPGTVSLELILVNTMLAHRPSQSMGTVEVKSSPRWRLYGNQPPPEPETLTFSMPDALTFPSFDEITIRFKLDAPRTDTGAKIAIERFLFVPR